MKYTLTQIALAFPAFVIIMSGVVWGVDTALAITDEPHAGMSASAPDAGPMDAGSDASTQDAQPDAGSDAAAAQAEPDATAPTCICNCPCANADASSPNADASSPPAPSAVETAIRQHVLPNGRIPQEVIEALTCEELAEVHDAIWGRHGYFFPDDRQRTSFAARYDGLYVPLLHVNEATIVNYLTARDNLNLMLLGRAAYNKGCHRSAPAP